MFRFFCEICTKIKRVQRIPSRIMDESLGDPLLRIGRCDKHYRTKIVRPITIRTNKVEAVVNSGRKGKKR